VARPLGCWVEFMWRTLAYTLVVLTCLAKPPSRLWSLGSLPLLASATHHPTHSPTHKPTPVSPAPTGASEETSFSIITGSSILIGAVVVGSMLIIVWVGMRFTIKNRYDIIDEEIKSPVRGRSFI